MEEEQKEGGWWKKGREEQKWGEIQKGRGEGDMMGERRGGDIALKEDLESGPMKKKI